jgi:hypothetical protein
MSGFMLSTSYILLLSPYLTTNYASNLETDLNPVRKKAFVDYCSTS